MKHTPTFLAALLLAPLAPLCGAEPTYHPAVEAFFGSTNSFIQRTVLPSIEQNRKGAAQLRFVAPDGQPLANLKVVAELRRHEFLFGYCAPDGDQWTNTSIRNAWADLVNYTVAHNICKWENVERTEGTFRYNYVDELAGFCRQHDIALEYHFLTGYHPAWITNQSAEARARLQERFARDVVQRYRDKMMFFQVYNEDWLTHVPRGKVFFDQTAFFAAMTKDFPGIKFGVSDCWRLNRSDEWPTPAELQKRYPGIAFLSIHAHAPRGLWANPQDMYHQFDRFRDSNIKLHITEFGINLGKIEGGYRSGEWTEANKAEYFVQTFATAFSHPAVESINLWDTGRTKIFLSGNFLLKPDGTPLPAYHALRSLIRDKFHTRAAGNTGADGRFGFRGFCGQYALTIETTTGRKLATDFKLTSKLPEIVVVCDMKDGTLRVKPE